jgi:hypothetical protein
LYRRTSSIATPYFTAPVITEARMLRQRFITVSYRKDEHLSLVNLDQIVRIEPTKQGTSILMLTNGENLAVHDPYTDLCRSILKADGQTAPD